MFNPYFQAILAAIIWGTSGPFIKITQLPPSTLVFFRTALPTLILAGCFFATSTPLFRGNNRRLLLASAINSARMLLYFVAFTSTSIGNAVVILYTWPLFAAIFASLFLKERIPFKNILLILLAFAGILIIYSNNNFSFQNKDVIGITAMLGSAALNALMVILFKSELKKHSKWKAIFYQNLIGALLFLPFLFINSPFPNTFQTSTAIIYACLIGLVAFGLFFSALNKLPASTTSALTYFEAISGICFGILFFNEILTIEFIIGGLCIIMSAVFLKK